ncbi:MAG: ATP-binding protein [Reichenbachiella sp.]
MRKVLALMLILIMSVNVYSQDVSISEAQSLLEKTKYNKKRGNLEGALGYGLLGLDQAESLDNGEMIVEFKSVLGEIYLSKKDYKKAINYFAGIMLYSKRVGDQQSLAKGIFSLANTYSRMGAYNKASDYYYQVSVIYDKMDPKLGKHGKASAYEALGLNYVNSNQPKKAIDIYERLYDLAISGNLYSYIGRSQEKLFLQSILLGNTKNAIKYGSDYYERIKDRGNNKVIAETADLLSGQYLKILDNKSAIKFSTIAVQKNPNKTEYKVNHAKAQARNADYQKSISTFNETIDIFERQRKQSSVATTYNEMALVAIENNDLKGAANYLSKAETIANQKNSKTILLETYRLYLEMYKKKGAEASVDEFQIKYNAVRQQVGDATKIVSKVSISKENLAESYEQEARAIISSEENQKLASEREDLRKDQKLKNLELIEKRNRLQEIELQQTVLEAERVQQDLLLNEQSVQAKLNEEQLGRIKLESENIRLADAERKKEFKILQKDKELLQQQKEFEENQTKQAKLLQYIVSIGASVILFVIAIAFYRTYNTGRTIKEQNQNLAEQQKTILNRNIQLKKSSEAMLAMNNKIKKAHVNLKVLLKKEQSTREELENANAEIKNTQVHLVQSEKMSSLGLLTAGIAHEINNPINFVSSGVQSLLQNFEELRIFIQNYQKVIALDDFEQIKKYRGVLQEDEDALDDLQSGSEELLVDVNYGIKRITEIVNGLRTFSRHDEAEVKDADINESFSSALLILQNKYKNKAEIVQDMDETMPQIQCFPGQLNQVFVNLINNALDAMEGDQGIINISTKNLNDDFVEIRIGDTGTGMPPEVRDKIFDPFFTTKDYGKGTGLGLSISHGIIEKHNGSIEVESEVGVGTTFIIKLPKRLELDEKVLENQLN